MNINSAAAATNGSDLIKLNADYSNKSINYMIGHGVSREQQTDMSFCAEKNKQLSKNNLASFAAAQNEMYYKTIATQTHSIEYVFVELKTTINFAFDIFREVRISIPIVRIIYVILSLMELNIKVYGRFHLALKLSKINRYGKLG